MQSTYPLADKKFYIHPKRYQLTTTKTHKGPIRVITAVLTCTTDIFLLPNTIRTPKGYSPHSREAGATCLTQSTLYRETIKHYMAVTLCRTINVGIVKTEIVDGKRQNVFYNPIPIPVETLNLGSVFAFLSFYGIWT